MAVPDAYRAISLIEFNVGAAAAVGFLNPLGAQLDALLALGLGPFQVTLAAQFNAALAAQASISLTVGLGQFAITAQFKAAISALAQLQAALSASLALGLPPVQFGLNANLAATAALAATLQAQLGGLQLLIKAAIAVKVPAIRTAASLNAALAAGPFFAISFSGETLQDTVSWLSAEVANGGLSADSHVLRPADQTYGIFLFGSVPSFSGALAAIISVPT